MNITQPTTQSRKAILLTSLRTLLYGGLVVALAEFMKWDASQFMGMDKFTEGSYTESLQATFLILSSVLLLIHFIKNKSFVALLILALTAASAVREFDDFFDSIFNGAW